jgi:hypothetical protein
MRSILAIATTAIVATANVSAQRVSELGEPNQTASTATNITCGEEAIGALISASDEDWYRIVLTQTADLRITTGPTFSGEIRDTVLTLLDSTGGPLVANEDTINSGLYAQIFAASLPAGTYYAAVSAGPSAASSGGYLLDVNCQNPFLIPTPPIVNESVENNDPRTGGVATNAFVPLRCSGNISATGASGDWDFWRIWVFGDSMLRLRLDATANHPNAMADDVVVYVCEPTSPYSVLAGPFYATDTSEWDQVIDIRVPGGIYNLVVRGAEGSQAGDYYLDCAVSPSASNNVQSGGCGGRQLSLPVTTYGPGNPQTLEAAHLASTYAVEASNLGVFGYAFHVVGLQSTFIDLSGLGAPGCALEVVNLVTNFRLADSTGRATWTIFVPDNTALLGTTLHSQVAVLDLSNPLGITLSNLVSSTIGY